MQFEKNIIALNELSKANPSIDILKEYKGFGGVRNQFYNKCLYGRLMDAIRANVGVEQQIKVLNSLKQSVSSAYYTPPPVIKFMYYYLTGICNFEGGDILEPACGSGEFFEHMPEELITNSKVTGIEYDLLTAKLAQKIHPHVKVINDGLQFVDFNQKYDLIIGNPPFSGEKIEDLKEPDISGYSIHHYFIAKCIRLLKDDGILAFVMPSYFMDLPRANTRHIVNKEAVILNVFRLPEDLFDHATVTVDVVFLRKVGKRLHDIEKVSTFKQGDKKDMVNNYWLKNPMHILGELQLKWVNAYSRYVPACVNNRKEELLHRLENPKFNQTLLDNYNQIVLG